MRKSRVLTVSAALAAPLLAGAVWAPAAFAADTTMYQATLNSLNSQTGATGTLSLTLNGSSATITEHVSGLAPTFMNAPYPHVQHIHGGAQGVCPDMSADKSGDGVVSTVEGQPSYGKILTTLSTSGDTSPAAGTNVKTAPSGGSYDYSRTIQLDDATMQSIQGGNAVIVVHGDDPSKLPSAAQSEKSELVPSLPLAATSPALCGALKAMPAGAAATGGGSTAGIEDGALAGLGAVALLGAGGALAYRRPAQATR